MATQTGAQRVQAANAQIAYNGGVAPSAGDKKGQALARASGSSGNPKDAPNYVAGSATDDRVGPITQQLAQVDKAMGNITPDGTALTAPKNNLQPKTQTNAGNAFTGNGLKLQPSPTGTTTVPDLASQYKQVQQNLDQSGQAPQNAGGGSAMVNRAMGTFAPKESPTILGGMQEVDSNFDSIFTQYDDYFSPQKQRTSLLDEYKKMSESLGISGLNAEIVNTKRILEGTEDDIRNEITSTGGLATDSQVMAMANARNKTLLKNYQTLIDTRDNATTQLTTMMNLSVQDRQFAEAEFDRKMNFGFKVAEFKQKATDNARSGLQWAITNGAGAEILNNPYETRLAEKTLGIPPGGLAGMVQKQALATEKAQLENTKLLAEIDNLSGVGGINEKTMGKIQASPEYKTINGVLPAMKAVKDYLSAVQGTGSFEILSGTKSGNLKATYGNAIAAWKTLAALGALSGADFGLAENVIPEPSLFTRNSKVKSQLTSAVDNAISQAEIMTKRLSQNYPVADTLLNQQLDDMRVVAHPEQYTYGDDGLVYKIK